MKSLRNFIMLLTSTLFIGLSLMACNGEKKGEQQSTCDNAVELSAVKDSLEKCSEKIDNLSNKLNEYTRKVDSISGKQGDQYGKVWLWVLSGVAIVAFFVAIYSLVCFRRLNKRLNRHRNDLESLKSDKQSVSFAPKPVSKNSTPSDYENLKRRVFDLERRIQQPALATRPNPKPAESVVKPAAQPMVLQGYFGNPIGTESAYFKKMLISCDSEARFSVDYLGNKATFRPLDSGTYFGTFVSNDAMRVAVDFEGCPTSQASSMQVVAPGEAELRDNKWIIIKKSIVKLS